MRKGGRKSWSAARAGAVRERRRGEKTIEAHAGGCEWSKQGQELPAEHYGVQIKDAFASFVVYICCCYTA